MSSSSSSTDVRRSAGEILRESENFFGQRGAVHKTLRALARRLEQETIPYAVVGGMAMNLHGFTRETVDVDILMTPEGLEKFRERFLGRGYRPAFSRARKSFQDTRTKVKIEVLTTGEYPGDGKPKSVSFPDPGRVSIERDGFRLLALEKLIELKLASGLSAEHRRLVDLGDVQRLIEELRLPLDLADRLDASVRAEYRSLWNLAQRRGIGPHERD